MFGVGAAASGGAAATGATAAKGAWLQPVVQGGMGIFGSLFGARQARKAWQRSVRHEQMVWDRETAYNSPAAQMQRLKEAGLNPNLMYGQGTTGNATGGKAMESQPFANQQDFLSAAMLLSEIELKRAQRDKLDADTAFTNQREGTEVLKQDRLRQDLEQLERKFPEMMNALERANRIGNATEKAQIHRTAKDALYAEERLVNEIKRSGLLDADLKIRQEVLESKELMNKLTQIQVKFLENGDIEIGQLLRLLASMMGGRF